MLQQLFKLWCHSTLPLVVFLFHLTKSEGTELFLYCFVLQRCKETPVRSKSPSINSLLFSSVYVSRKKQNSVKTGMRGAIVVNMQAWQGLLSKHFFPLCAAATSVQHFLSLLFCYTVVLKTEHVVLCYLIFWKRIWTKMFQVQCVKFGPFHIQKA